MSRILIVGATSAIAQAIARQYSAQSGHELVLVGRNQDKLDAMVSDLTVRGAKRVEVICQDLSDPDQMDGLVEHAWSLLSAIDIAIVAHGTLPDQKAIQDDWPAVSEALKVNGLSYLALMTALGERMAARYSGSIAVIGSVAGDRGRQSNYVYGSAKGLVALFSQGMRNRLLEAGVHVLTVKPGFVDTPMTESFDKGGPLWATPEKVACDVVNAIEKKRNVLYTPWFWWGIMVIIRSIPEMIFKKLSL